MPDDPISFRDFGIVPEDFRPPAGVIRSFLSTGRILGQYLATFLICSIGLGVAALFVSTMPPWLGLLGCFAALTGFGFFVHFVMRDGYRWVELDGDILRAKHLHTGRVVERSVDQIESLGVMVHHAAGRVQTVILEKLLGRVKAIVVRFRDHRDPIPVQLSDPAMTHAAELIEAILHRMTRIRELDVEIADHNGKPLIRSIRWKGEPARVPPGQGRRLACCFTIMALLIGGLLAYMGLEAQEERELGSVPPSGISARSLIRDGPGSNRHVTITDFLAGGYAYEGNAGSWTTISIVLFPADAPLAERGEIKLVLTSQSVRDPAALQQLLRQGRLPGICSESPRSNWGTVLGTNLTQANGGSRLASAWWIKELREPPGAIGVWAMLIGAATCFAACPILTLLFLRKE